MRPIPPILHSVERSWRVLATALCFFLFGLTGLLMRLLAFPVLGVCVQDPQRRLRAARGLIRVFCRGFVELMRLLGILTYEFHGSERLQRGGQLILANHPSLIDVLFLLAYVPNADCVVKSALARNPFTRGPIAMAGYIRNEGGPQWLAACVASLHAGGNLIIFPEGTRSCPGQPLALQRGAANVALRGARDITPVRILCEPPMLLKGQKWYAVPSRPSHFRFEVGHDLPVAPWLGGESPMPLAVRALTARLQQYFSAGPVPANEEGRFIHASA